MNRNASYYYNLLSKEGQQAYYCIRSGLEKLEPSFPVPRLSGKELADIYFMVRLDHPELFYTVTFRYRYYPDSEMVEMIPEYIFSKKQMKEQISAMQSRIRKLARPAEKLDEKGKEEYIHDFILEHVHYDKLKKPYSHEIIGALGHGVGVCEGIAKTVKVLCDALDIWCIVAVSEANPEKKIRYRHAWNVIRIGGQYYHLDATFDNSLTNPQTYCQNDSEKIKRYDYYNLNDKQFFRDHEPVIWRVPACTDGGKSWYQEKKLSFTKMEDVRKRAAQAVKKGKVLLFHWRGGYLTKEVLEKLLLILREEAEKKNRRLALSLNWPQAVLQVSFRDAADSEQIVLEEANEGELYEENGGEKKQ